jgi:hypothetical protein
VNIILFNFIFLTLKLVFNRSSCKFIHCARNDEDHFKQTGELPDGVNDPEGRAKKSTGSVIRGSKGKSSSRSNNGNSENDVPLCKDFLKGICDRPPGGNKNLRFINTDLTEIKMFIQVVVIGIENQQPLLHLLPRMVLQ